MTQVHFRSSLIAIVVVILSAVTPAPGWAQSSMAQVGIADLSEASTLFAKAVADGDVQRIGSFYAENAILFSPDGNVAIGRDNITRVYARNAQAGTNRMVFKQVSVESEGARGSIIWLWDLTITPRGQAPVVLTGRSLLYLAKTPFGWKILYDMFQLPPPATGE